MKEQARDDRQSEVEFNSPESTHGHKKFEPEVGVNLEGLTYYPGSRCIGRRTKGIAPDLFEHEAAYMLIKLGENSRIPEAYTMAV